MQIILSWGMGVDSTAILLRWIFEPSTCPCPLLELLVLVAQTGDEYEDTRRNCETHILPLLRQRHIRLVQVARRGHLEADGIAVLSDSREPERLHTEGAYRLFDELRSAGTVPQFGGEHRCSLKFKAFVIERWLRDHLSTPALHAFGYSNDEPKRVLNSEAAMARRIAFGFSEKEQGRATQASGHDRADRTAFYPLIEWGWGRRECLDFIALHLGVIWQKSACVYCPFNALGPDAIARHRLHPAQVADALSLELVSITLNPRGQLYKKQSLHEATVESGNREALLLYGRVLENQPWRLYRVRRIYAAKKDAEGRDLTDRKGQAIRAVEHCSAEMPIASCEGYARAQGRSAGRHARRETWRFLSLRPTSWDGVPGKRGVLRRRPRRCGRKDAVWSRLVRRTLGCAANDSVCRRLIRHTIRGGPLRP